MAIDKIFNDKNVDGIADNIFNAVNNSVSEVKQMQQRKAAENAQMVVQSLKKIDTDIREKYDNVATTLEKRIITIKDGRDGSSGKDGRDGKDGKAGRDGANGKQGLQGPKGQDGLDGIDGVSVTNANIDFDGSLIINLSSGVQINAGEVVSPELEKKIIAVTKTGGSSGAMGDVRGPASSTDNAVSRFDSTTGKLIQNSVVIIGDTGNMSGVGTLNTSGGALIQGLTVGLGAGSISTNTAVGVSALNSNTVGANNTAIGRLALLNNLDGSSNTVVGDALSSNTSGSNNIAIGTTASFNNTIGSQNVAIGLRALGVNSTSSGNTAVGYYAGSDATGGSNTFLGNNSGNAVTSGSNNVVIGSYTGSTAPISATGSNYIVLSDGAGTVRQTIDSSGNVGINTTAPAAKLDVAGSNNSTWSATTTSISGTTMTIAGTVTGTIAIGDLVYGTDVQPYTRITAGSALSWTVSVSQTVASATLVGGPTYSSTLVRITETDSAVSAGQPTGGLQFYTSDANAPTAGVGAYVAALSESTAPDTSLVFGTRNDAGGGVDANERMRIESTGRLIVGYTAAVGAAQNTNIQSQSTSGAAGFTAFRWSNDIIPPRLQVGKSRGSAVGTNAIVQLDDQLGGVYFYGDDGTDLVSTAASIVAEVDGDPGLNDMPGRLTFNTTNDGSQTPTERTRIDSAGRLRQFGDTILSNVNVIGASYDSVSFSVAAEETNPADLFFSPDGLKMYIIGTSGDDVNEYNLSTAWVVSSAVYSTVFSVAGQETTPIGIFFRADGTKMYIVGTGNDTVFQYALSTPWSVATASYESISFSVATQETSPSALFFKPNGLSMYVVGATGDAVYQYTLSTAWNVSTATFLQSFSVSGQETAPNGLFFTGDGSRMFVSGTTGDDVNVYNLTTPWDISTSVFVNVFSVSAQDTAPVGIYIKPDGTKMYIMGQTNDTVFQYTVPSIDIQLTGQTSVAALDVQQDLIVYGNTQAYKISASNGVLVTSPAGLGYGTGSGGAVTQLTSRTTGVTLSKPSGAITMFSAAGSVVAATFTVTNTLVAATDTIILNQKSGTNLYVLLVTAVAAGSFNVTFYTTGGVATDAPVINFSLIKGVTA